MELCKETEKIRWDDWVSDGTLKMVKDIEEVKREDLVRGKWHVPKVNKGIVWCDASSIVMVVVLEVGGARAENATWLRKETDANHINVTELEILMKDINLALKWELRNIEVEINSATLLTVYRLREPQRCS